MNAQNSPEETTATATMDVLFGTSVMDKLTEVEAAFEQHRFQLAARGVRPQAYREAVQRLRRMQTLETDAKRRVLDAMRALQATRSEQLRELNGMNQLLAILKEVRDGHP